MCVGIDPVLEKIPVRFRKTDEKGNLSVTATFVAFCEFIIRETCDVACAYKPNSAFFEAHGIQGLIALEHTCDLVRQLAPDVPIILDAKRADIGNTNKGYAAMAFDWLKADAITVHPYLGREALVPLLERKGKGIFVLCRTSNKGAREFQDIRADGQPLYMRVAHQVAHTWNTLSNCGLVVGATYPDELNEIRRIVGGLPILIPGVGTQGGDLQAAVLNGRNRWNKGFIINSSSGIIFDADPRKKALEIHETIQQLL